MSEETRFQLYVSLFSMLMTALGVLVGGYIGVRIAVWQEQKERRRE